MILSKWQRAKLAWKEDPGRKARAGYWQFIIQLVIFLALEYFRPKPELEDAKPSGLGDFKFPTATEGRLIPIIWGTVRVDAPNVVWYGDLVQEPIEETVRTGLFSKDTFVKGYRYYIGMQMAIALGDDDSDILLRGMWTGDTRLFNGSVADGGTFEIDEPEVYGGDDHGSGGFNGTFKFFAGTSTQLASSYLSNHQTITSGDTPAYRGIMYVTNDSEPAWVGNSTSIKPWKYEIQRVPNGLGLTSLEAYPNLLDANPANVLYEILTNTVWGLGYDTSTIDTTSFSDAGSTLYSEGAGWSFLLDRPMQAHEIQRLVEEQIDGVVRWNRQTGLWELKLIRDDYDIETIPEIDESNIQELVNFSRGSWEATSNQVRVQYTKRSNGYTQSYAFASDPANDRITESVSALIVNYPGVKDNTQANKLAWRDLRSYAYPLASASVVVDRSFYDVLPGDVIKLTMDYMGISEMPMRVTKIDYGSLENGRIRLELIQDIFYDFDASSADSEDTNWEEPTDELVAFATDEQIAFETPAAIVARDPSNITDVIETYTFMAAARGGGSAIDFTLTEGGDVLANGARFMKMGELTNALGKDTIATAEIDVTADPDSQDDLIDAFDATATATTMGLYLVNLVLIDDEFMFVADATVDGSDVTLDTVRRGVLDSAQADHAAGASVYVLHAGAVQAGVSYSDAEAVSVKLLPSGYDSTLAEGSATSIDFTIDRRVRRPYPPSQVDLNGNAWDTTDVSLVTNGTGDDLNALVLLYRRDFTVGLNAGDEVAQLGVDQGAGDYGLQHVVEVRHDPGGTNDLIQSGTVTGDSDTIRQLDVLEALSGALPTGDLRITVTAQHTVDGELLDATQDIVHDFSVTTSVDGEHAWGVSDAGVESPNAWTIPSTSSGYVFTLSTAFSSSDVEYELNDTDSWSTLISAGATSSGSVSLTASDTMRVRWTAGDSGVQKLLSTTSAPGTGAFAVFSDS